MFGPSPCEFQQTIQYVNTNYYDTATGKAVTLPDREEQHKAFFVLETYLPTCSISVQLDPNNEQDCGKDVFYYREIVYPCDIPDYPYDYPTEPDTLAFILSCDNNPLPAQHKLAWMRKTGFDNVADDVSDTHGTRSFFEYRIEWGYNWVSGTVVYTTRYMRK